MSARDWLYSRLVATRRTPERVQAKLDAYRAEVLREAAAKIREAAKGGCLERDRCCAEGAADLIDPDKEESADGAQ